MTKGQHGALQIPAHQGAGKRGRPLGCEGGGWAPPFWHLEGARPSKCVLRPFPAPSGVQASACHARVQWKPFHPFGTFEGSRLKMHRIWKKREGHIVEFSRCDHWIVDSGIFCHS